MGCTSSNQTGTTKETANAAPTTISDDGQQLINDHFRTWLKTNRPKADEYVLHDVLSTAQPSNEVEDYKSIVSKALDLLSDRHDIKSTNKLGKLVQKEIALASPKKVAHTIDILKQTADKLRNGNIQLDIEEQAKPSTPVETIIESAVLENQHTQVLSGEPGIALKEALEKARVLFYKGKQAAIFANPNGGYDVRILDENDETINHDGNLLRSIVVTEVKMRPKSKPMAVPLFTAPPPPPPPPPPIPSKLLDENEISDDFRRSIDAALKGLEAVYQTSTTTAANLQSMPERVQEIHVEKTAKQPQSPTTPIIVQYGVTNFSLPKSTSQEQTKLSNDLPATNDRTANLAEIVRQMGEQQKTVSEKLSKENNEDKEQGIYQADIQPKLVGLVDNMNELIMDTIDVTTCSEIADPLSSADHEKLLNINSNTESEGQIERIVKEIKEHGEKFESNNILPHIVSTVKQPSSYSLGLTSPLQNETKMTTSTSLISQPKPKLRSENRPKSFIANDEVPSKNVYNLNKQTSLDELLHLTQTGLSNPHLTTSVTKLGISTSSGKIEEEQQVPTVTAAEPLTKMPTSISQIIEEHRTIIDEPSSAAFSPPPVVTPVETHIKAKSPSHNVTYTEITHSESRDGEQSRRFISESTDQNISHDDNGEQTTTLKVITKSEFSNHPTLGDKIMEQSVQVITVKVRNETIKTTIQQATLPSTADNDITYERRPVSELVKNFEVVAATNTNNVNT
ncbi:unnamed protein product [Rotaria socialis]|uniref:Uncharacterized protein n=1 Tax=Rotaria socialis TaxID=392032 RepID=A0A820FBC0_9BILA|nr:unnamed protein product [Rotaria socialis]CAF4258939.1 unnamed protein product [Rotaria socialis]